MIRVGKYVLYDILRSRFIIFYTALLMIVSFSMFSLDNDAGKSTLSLLNIVLLVVPMVSIVFTTIHLFNSYEFIELLLSQPVNRRTIFLAEFFSAASALCVAFLIGVGLPVAIFNFSESSAYLVLSGLLLTVVFVALAFAGSVTTRDKARGIGIALTFWFFFTLIYDGLILYIIYSFSDYPMEKVTLILASMNPIDLARIIIMLKLDISALMGYTGAFYKSFFGTFAGMAYSFFFLLVWIVVPLSFALKKFDRRDM